MKKVLIAVFFVCAVASTAFADDGGGVKVESLMPELSVATPTSKVNHPQKVMDKVMKKTVVMLAQDRAFCSGVIARDDENKMFVYTAAHCCAVYVGYGIQPEALTYDNRTIKLFMPDDSRMTNISEGTDACRLEIKPGNKVTTNVKTGPLGRQATLFGVSAFPNYSPSQRVPAISVMGKTFFSGTHYVTSSSVNPGMSGSPVIDVNGRVVGFMVAHFLYTPYPNAIISVMEYSGFLKTPVIVPDKATMKSVPWSNLVKFMSGE